MEALLQVTVRQCAKCDGWHPALLLGRKNKSQKPPKPVCFGLKRAAGPAVSSRNTGRLALRYVPFCHAERHISRFHRPFLPLKFPKRFFPFSISSLPEVLNSLAWDVLPDVSAGKGRRRL